MNEVGCLINQIIDRLISCVDIAAPFSVIQQKARRFQRYDCAASARKRYRFIIFDDLNSAYITASGKITHSNLRDGNDLITADCCNRGSDNRVYIYQIV